MFVGPYIVDVPSPQVLVEADQVYQRTLYENRFENMLDSSRTDLILMQNGMWSLSEDAAFKELPKKLDDAKLNLYNNALVPSTQKRLRTHISSLKNQYNQLITKKTVFDQYTRQFLAENERQRFIFSNIILNKKYKQTEVRPLVIDKVIAESKKYTISIKKYRELARSDEWQSIWSATKLGSFRVIGEEQRTLISYTSLYENVAKHPEAPSEAVIKDDDMLDGWMIFIRNKQEKEKRVKDFEKSSVEGKGNEQFIMTSKSPEDIKRVMEMNDTEGKVIQAKLHAMAKQKGVANEYDIQEVRQNANIIKK